MYHGNNTFLIVASDCCLEEACKELLANVTECYNSKDSKKKVTIFHCSPNQFTVEQ